MVDIDQLPVPDWGLRCPHCDEPLAGLAEHRCARCQRRFDIRDVLAAHRPIPDIGLKCPGCGYLITGLTESTCPECATAFSLHRMLEQTSETPVLGFDAYPDPVDHLARRREPQFTGDERPLPDFGLFCLRCERALADATESRCSGCGQPFQLSALLGSGEPVDITQSVPPRVFANAKAILYAAQVPYMADEPGLSIALGLHSPFGRSRLRVPREFFFDALYYLTAAAHGAAHVQDTWTCASCAELVPAGFELCWKCGAPYFNRPPSAAD